MPKGPHGQKHPADIIGNAVHVTRKEGKRLIIQPQKTQRSLSELLDSWESTDERLPEISDPPPEPVDLS